MVMIKDGVDDIYKGWVGWVMITRGVGVGGEDNGWGG